MTELLQRAIAEIEKLPAEEQNAIATRLLDELKDEQGWKIRFAATTNSDELKQPFISRRELIKLPREERQKILAAQSEVMLEHYNVEEMRRFYS
ncbi:hypothetical protein IQ227_16565 [Anabaena aphanizomenioides LEGE 00250]|jgi:hypothetical protein|uniref:Uncharacterized protein n=1 Tax=Sphaerospermopsis aphanizomenoides LEGE 00250 TaxID=2777972 RepID=A0ABR9VGG6_9CYAN|nr:hypothetical protein [Sphaerospermopsis aphanizomenoides]MBE9237593.1 hypothetical protein [Sphaerospermopsis aphanizomenoides LEGE 00250]